MVVVYFFGHPVRIIINTTSYFQELETPPQSAQILLVMRVRHT